MNPQIAELLAAKQARRRKIMLLPIEERILIVEKLRDFAIYMRKMKESAKK